MRPLYKNEVMKVRKKRFTINFDCTVRVALFGLFVGCSVNAQELPEIPTDSSPEPTESSVIDKVVVGGLANEDLGSISKEGEKGELTSINLKAPSESKQSEGAVILDDEKQILDTEAPTQQVSENKLTTSAGQVKTENQKGITTIDLDEGNWLLKRKALERTMNTVEEVNNLFKKIMELRMSFLVKRNKVDRDFDIFANKSGFQIGDLNQLSAAHIERMEEMRKNAGQLSEQERELLQEMEQKSKEVKELQDELSRITDLDASLDDALMQVEQEIEQANGYQAQSWRNFQAIKKVLNDEKAEELALRTEGLLNNMKDIYTYLTGQLSAYFNQTTQSIQDGMNKIADKVSEFKSNEETLKAGLEKFLMLDRQEKQKEEAEEKARLEEAQKKLKELQEQQKRESQSLLHRVFEIISYPFMLIWEKVVLLFN